MSEVKLNLGCYNKQLPGFINVDIRPECDPDVIDDAFKLEKFEKESVDLIYSSHMLEHLSYKDTLSALRRWYELLKKGGVLRLAVPDFNALCRRYMYTGDIEEVLHSMMGSQKHAHDFHLNCFDQDRLTALLVSVGFDDVRKWQWHKIEPHNYCDDFSQAYLPSEKRDLPLSHGRILVQGGLHVSLNLEAVK